MCYVGNPSCWPCVIPYTMYYHWLEGRDPEVYQQDWLYRISACSGLILFLMMYFICLEMCIRCPPCFSSWNIVLAIDLIQDAMVVRFSYASWFLAWVYILPWCLYAVHVSVDLDFTPELTCFTKEYRKQDVLCA